MRDTVAWASHLPYVAEEEDGFVWRGTFEEGRATTQKVYRLLSKSNVLAYAQETEESFSAADQLRYAYSGGLRLDYGNALSKEHLLKAGFQIDRTQAVNDTNLVAFQQLGGGDRNPTGVPINLSASNRTIGWREEFWIQDQYTPTDQWTFNLGLRYDQSQYFYNEGQVSPRIGVAYKLDETNRFHLFYGRLFTPPNLERVPFLQLNTIGTTAEPENLTANKARAERSHYTEAGWAHAFSQRAVMQVVGYYKINRYMSDAGQFGTTPLLNSGPPFFRGANGSTSTPIPQGTRSASPSTDVAACPLAHGSGHRSV
jgi:outer membrane receptor protein involved in Fe transport